MTERERPQLQAAKISFLGRMDGLSPPEGLGEKFSKIFRIERHHLRCVRQLLWMSPGRLLVEVFQACPTGRRLNRSHLP